MLWLSLAAGIATLLAVPTSLLPTVRIVIIAASVLVFFVSCFVFLVLSAKSRRIDHQILSMCIVTFIVAAIHDLLTLTGVLPDNFYYITFTSQLLMVGMAFMLAWHFVANLRRIERFNDELEDRIDDARSELTATLHR